MDLQQLEEQIKHEFIEGLKNSKLGEIFQKHGVGGHNVLQVQCILDPTKLHLSNADESKQIQEFLPTDQELRILVASAVCVNSQCGLLNTNCR